MRTATVTRVSRAVRSACRNRRFVPTFGALVVLAALATGCGGGGDSSTTATVDTEARERAQERIRQFGLEATPAEAKQAKAALHGYLNARADGEWQKACSYLPKSIRHLMGRLGSKSKEGNSKGCAGFVETTTRKLSPSERADLAKIDVTSVRVEGDQGYVLYKDSSDAELSTSMKIEDGKWKVAGITGTPLQ